MFFVEPWEFEMPNVGPVHNDNGQRMYGVFSRDDGPDEPAYCNATGTLLECNTQAAEWNGMVARGRRVIIAPVIRIG